MNTSSTRSGEHRPEIDGLRALAVMPVILFHAGAPHFRGGYLGVDVFFVISGYLITSILLREMVQGRYSLSGFYERRARRILPALLVVITACMPLAFTFMLPVELEQFSRSALSALCFIPNVFFWLNSSYFQNTSELLPLLHTWSLGVEEQFYLLFPLFLVAIWRYRPRARSQLIFAVMLVSMLLAEWAWRTDRASAGFFLAPTRAWELMIGCLVASVSTGSAPHQTVHRVLADLLAAIGLAMLIVSLAVLDESTPMPSLWGLIPTVGTAMVISYTRRESVVCRLLSFAPLVRLGLISYSAYLWHQPLFAFSRLSIGPELGSIHWALLVAAVLALANLTWQFIETPFRDRNKTSVALLSRASIACAVAIASIASMGILTEGMKSRLSKQDQALAALADRFMAGRDVPDRFHALNRDFSKAATRKILVVGDSYAQDFINATYESGNVRDAEFSTSYISWDCQIYFGSASTDRFIEPRFRPKCVEEHAARELWERLPKADAVLLIGAWRSWAIDRLPETIAKLRLRADQRVFVVGPKNFGEINIRSLLRIDSINRPGVRQEPSAEAVQLNGRIRRAVQPGMFVDVQTTVCGVEATCPVFTPESELISFDGTHLTSAGARWLGSKLWAELPLSELWTASP